MLRLHANVVYVTRLLYLFLALSFFQLSKFSRNPVFLNVLYSCFYYCAVVFYELFYLFFNMLMQPSSRHLLFNKWLNYCSTRRMRSWHPRITFVRPSSCNNSTTWIIHGVERPTGPSVVPRGFRNVINGLFQRNNGCTCTFVHGLLLCMLTSRRWWAYTGKSLHGDYGNEDAHGRTMRDACMWTKSFV